MTYKSDPRWQAANAQATSPLAENESPAEALGRRVMGTFDQYLVELEYEEVTSS